MRRRALEHDRRPSRRAVRVVTAALRRVPGGDLEDAGDALCREMSVLLGERVSGRRSAQRVRVARCHTRLLRELPDAIGVAYESVLRSTDDSGRSTGRYYTPGALVELVLDTALTPAIKARAKMTSTSRDPAAPLLDLRVCDPACGCGAFLIPSARRLADAVARVRAGAPPTARQRRGALREVVERCLVGVDLDPVAVRLCQAALRMLCGDSPEGPASLRIVTGDAWRGMGDEGESVFPALQLPPGSGFDVVVGNPPFANVIEGPMASSGLRAARYAHRELLTGTADCAFHFLALAGRLVKRGGWVGMVQPRALLNAASAAPLREVLVDSGPHPRAICSLPRNDHFPGAKVFVCTVALGPPGAARVSMPDSTRAPTWSTGSIGSTNWWSEIQRIAAGRIRVRDRQATRLGDVFEVRAGMTASEAYDVVPYVVDRRRGAGLRLVTTGLIDPEQCYWGARRCRFLGQDYAYPRIEVRRHAGMPTALRRRLLAVRHPKLIIAGLTREVECFADTTGDCAGAVSTFLIFDPDHNLGRLEKLCHHLLSSKVNARFSAERGSAGLRGAYLPMSRSFLEDLPLPRAVIRL